MKKADAALDFVSDFGRIDHTRAMGVYKVCIDARVEK